MTFTSCLAAIVVGSGIEISPDVWERKEVVSLHVMGFLSDGGLLVSETEGETEEELWDAVFEEAKAKCCGSIKKEDDEEEEEEKGDAMEVEIERQVKKEEEETLDQKMKEVVKSEVKKDVKWREDIR